MIDNVRFTIPFIIPQLEKQLKEPVIIYDTVCNPYYQKDFVAGYIGQWENMRIKANGRGIEVSGSWDTLYNGSNHTDFFLRDIVDTYHKLEEKTEGKISEAKVTRLETGVILKDTVYKTWTRYRGKSFTDMIGHNKVYGKILRMEKKHIKAYDKTYERKVNARLSIEPNLTKIELIIKSSNLLITEGIRKPIDLTKVDRLNNLSTLIQKHIKQISMIDYIELNGMNATDLKIFMAMTSLNSEASLLYKRTGSTFKRDKRKFNNWIKLNSKLQQDQINSKIKCKFDQLING